MNYDKVIVISENLVMYPTDRTSEIVLDFGTDTIFLSRREAEKLRNTLNWMVGTENPTPRRKNG